MEFRILGPLEVSADGRVLDLGGARQRALLAILLIRRGEVVPADRLIEDLYGVQPPATAGKSLQVHVSRLRKALGPAGQLRTRGGGYVLEGDLDLDRFELLFAAGRRALANGDPKAAAGAFTEGLALWRGPPLVDVGYEQFAQTEIARLEELRTSCIEERIDAELALGRHGDIVGELEQLVAMHPLRERLRAQLMVALYAPDVRPRRSRPTKTAGASCSTSSGSSPASRSGSWRRPSCSRIRRSISSRRGCRCLRVGSSAARPSSGN